MWLFYCPSRRGRNPDEVVEACSYCGRLRQKKSSHSIPMRRSEAEKVRSRFYKEHPYSYTCPRCGLERKKKR